MSLFRKIWLGIALLDLILLSSCTKENKPPEGIKITPEVLESVSASLAQESASISETYTVAPEIVPDITVSEIVYWTESGSVYHVTDQCSALRHSAKILHGSVEEAMEARKERPCKTCFE